MFDEPTPDAPAFNPQAGGAGTMQSAMPATQQNGPQGSNGFAQALAGIRPDHRAQAYSRAFNSDPDLWQVGNAAAAAAGGQVPFAAALGQIMQRDQQAARQIVATDLSAQRAVATDFWRRSQEAARNGNATHQALTRQLALLRPAMQPEDYIKLVAAVSEQQAPNGGTFTPEQVPGVVAETMRRLGIRSRPDVGTGGGSGGAGRGTQTERDAAAAARVEAQLNGTAPPAPAPGAGGGRAPRPSGTPFGPPQGAPPPRPSVAGVPRPPAPPGQPLSTPAQSPGEPPSAPRVNISPADRDAYNRHQLRQAQAMARTGNQGTFMQIGPNGEVTTYNTRDATLLTIPAASAEVQKLMATERGLRDAGVRAQAVLADIDRFGPQIIGPLGGVRGLIDTAISQFNGAAAALGINLADMTENQATALINRFEREASAAGNNEVAATRARFNANMLALAVNLARTSQGGGVLSNFDVQTQIRALTGGSPDQLRATIQNEMTAGARRYDNQRNVVERYRSGSLPTESGDAILRGGGYTGQAIQPGTPAVPTPDANAVAPPTSNPPAAAPSWQAASDAVARARQELGPTASDDDVVRRAQELLRGGR